MREISVLGRGDTGRLRLKIKETGGNKKRSRSRRRGRIYKVNKSKCQVEEIRLRGAGKGR